MSFSSSWEFILYNIIFVKYVIDNIWNEVVLAIQVIETISDEFIDNFFLDLYKNSDQYVSIPGFLKTHLIKWKLGSPILGW